MSWFGHQSRLDRGQAVELLGVYALHRALADIISVHGSSNRCGIDRRHPCPRNLVPSPPRKKTSPGDEPSFLVIGLVGRPYGPLEPSGTRAGQAGPGMRQPGLLNVTAQVGSTWRLGAGEIV